MSDKTIKISSDVYQLMLDMFNSNEQEMSDFTSEVLREELENKYLLQIAQERSKQLYDGDDYFVSWDDVKKENGL